MSNELCRLCSYNERRPVERTCSFCHADCCSIHRSIYGEWIVCSNCWDGIQDGRRTISPELRALMDESAARWDDLLTRIGQYWMQERAKGRSDEDLAYAVWGIGKASR